jgi:5-formyltetrahydrofolate cyclo-ligase
LEKEQIILERTRLRALGIERRENISNNMRDAYSELIRKKLIAYLDNKSAKFVHIYISFRSEVQTTQIIGDLIEREIKIFVPITEGNRMISSEFENSMEIIPGKYGVPEPKHKKEIIPEEINAVILPLVAFDGDGVRLGYGKGYYDRFLNHLGPETDRVGLAFSIQEMEKIPKLSHDELMFSVITEQNQFFFKNGVQK